MATTDEMDVEAVKAESDLKIMMEDSDEFVRAVSMIGAWWTQWLMRCGHKRLGRILVQEYKKMNKEA